ncbi:MAG TPA: serine/threonine-protein kinase [Kofleriaceae bacterium]|nr:serine/threonine-protein kinase [Kofleriaceae bacterium]
MDPAVSERKGETTRLGSFEVVRKLTSGGMAEIFLARTRGPSGFEKLVVLKKILPKYAGRQRYVQLFLDEARLAATLDHPNIVQVYDIGMVDGSYFFTMEYLHGQDVRTMLHRAWRTGVRFPIEDAVQIARHVASALHFAHEKQGEGGSRLGIVHRDVSPSNIIVTYDGATKLLDFGVAKTAASSVKTRTGTLKGKVAYMSPEQARGMALDRRSDIFSLGIVLWEMVTTQRLYRTDNDLATLQLIITQPAQLPSSLRPDCPPELERIVLRALARDPESRYQTADQLVTELDELAREHKLKQSPNALAQTLGQLFGPELAAWRLAREAGVPLADHLHQAAELTSQVSESDFIEIDEDDLDDEDDEDDEDDDDNDRTEHAAPIVEPLRDSAPELGAATELMMGGDVDTVMLRPISPSGMRTPGTPFPVIAGLPATPSRPFKAAPHGTPSAALPVAPAAATPSAVGSTLDALEALRARSPVEPEPDATEAVGMPHGAEHPEDVGDTPTARDGSAGSGGRAGGDPEAALDLRELAAFGDAGDAGDAGDDDVYDTVDASAPPGMRPPAQRGPELRAPTGPAALVVPRFGVPPWQSGQPANIVASAARGEPTARSWAVVALPPFDPEAFERRRRIVVRVASGLVTFVLLLAIVAGHC